MIGLSYDNRNSVNFDICRGVPSEERCHRDARTEILLGIESGFSPPDVDPDNAALSRLVGLLEWLDDGFPEEDWADYSSGPEIDDLQVDRITFAGHSQGGGHAAFTARLYNVNRALFFNATEAALWTTEDLATSPDRLFAARHTAEFGAGAMGRSWDQLELPGVDQSLDDAPTYDANRYITAREDCGGQGNAALHNCFVGDDFLPPDVDGEAAFVALWDAMLIGQ